MPDWSMESCLSCWLFTMMRQSSKKLPTKARGSMYVCLLIHVAISKVTLLTAPEHPWRNEFVAFSHSPMAEPNLKADLRSLLYILLASDHFWWYPAAISRSYVTSQGSLSNHFFLSIKYPQTGMLYSLQCSSVSSTIHATSNVIPQGLAHLICHGISFSSHLAAALYWALS